MFPVGFTNSVMSSSRGAAAHCYSCVVMTRLRAVGWGLLGSMGLLLGSVGCTPPPSHKTAAHEKEADDDDEPIRSDTRFDVGAVPPGPPKATGDCAAASVTRNPEVMLLDSESLSKALATPPGFKVTEPSDAAAATAPRASPLVPIARRMYRKGAGAPLSVELKDAARECELDRGEALAEDYTAAHEGLETKQTALGPASVGKDSFKAFVSGRCVLTIEGPNAGRLGPRFVDANALVETCATRTGAPIPR